MSRGRPSQRGRLALVVIALLGLSATSNAPAQADVEIAADSSTMATREANAVELQALADSKGALGIYLDEAAGEYVVVISSSGESTFVPHARP